MSAILMILVLLLLVVALAKSNYKHNFATEILPVTFMNSTSLFDPPSAQFIAEIEFEKLREELLNRANAGDFSALYDATKQQILYDEVLAVFAKQDLFATADYISRHDELRTNAPFAEALLEVWQQKPTRQGVAKLLYISALSDDAEIYFLAVNTVRNAWREQKIPDISGQELADVIETEYWLLKPSARETNMALKDFLTQMRTELHSCS
jgi:hypothetical protein